MRPSLTITTRSIRHVFHGKVDVARGQLHALRPGAGEASIEALETALTYLETQQGWIGKYQHWRDLGYPVGSGVVERAVALIIKRRMKRRGMRLPARQCNGSGDFAGSYD